MRDDSGSARTTAGRCATGRPDIRQNHMRKRKRQQFPMSVRVQAREGERHSGHERRPADDRPPNNGTERTGRRPADEESHRSQREGTVALSVWSWRHRSSGSD